MAIPKFNSQGDLPIGIYPATLSEVSSRFGVGSLRRQILFLRLERIFRIAMETGNVFHFIVFGSFVTAKLEPNDVDVFLLMENSFDYAQTSGEARLLFDHNTAQTHFGASVFWIRRLAAFDGEDAAVAHWQIKRDGTYRGIIELIQEA